MRDFLRRAVIGSLIVMGAASTAMATTPVMRIRAKLDDPTAGVFVVAHRGCHNPAPLRGVPSAPENSLAALENCVTIGVDMMETDIHRTKDGALVMVHDDSVDRTTNGVGLVSDLTLAQIRSLRLRENFGGATAPTLTDLTVPTLQETLSRSKGRIMLNLDIKGPIYSEVIAVVQAMGMTREVLVKTEVVPGAAIMADQSPYSAVPFMPIVRTTGSAGGAQVLSALITNQASGARKIPGVEVTFLTPPEFAAASAAARQSGVRLWTNTLQGVTGLVTLGNDQDALRSPEAVWGALIHQGAGIIQTDEPAALMDFVASRGLDRPGANSPLPR